MNSEIFSRLESLMKNLMLSVAEGSYTRAEMKAYAAGIELAAQKLEDVLKNLFADTADLSGLAMFLSLIGEKPAASQEESRLLITNAISAGRKALTKSEFNDIISSMGCSYGMLRNEIWLRIGTSFSKDLLEKITKLIKYYIPSTSLLVTTGSGQTFSKWDGLGLRWFELDSLNLPFGVVERL